MHRKRVERMRKADPVVAARLILWFPFARQLGGFSMNAYVAAMRRYVTFSGRASRKEFWMFWLIAALLAVAAYAIDQVLGTATEGSVGIIYGIVLLLHFLPSLSAAVRRFHDTDRSGWWYLILFVPLVGGIIFLVFLCKRSTPAPNRFGPAPLPI